MITYQLIMKATVNRFFSLTALKPSLKINEQQTGKRLASLSLCRHSPLPGPALALLRGVNTVRVVCDVLKKGVVGKTSLVVYYREGSPRLGFPAGYVW